MIFSCCNENRKNAVRDNPGAIIGTPSVAAPGTGYATGDLLTIAQSVSSGVAEVKVTSVTGTGGVTNVSLQQNGTNYETANGVATTGGSGTGCTLNVIAAPNGIDYLEVLDSDAKTLGLPQQQILLVHCLRKLAFTPLTGNVLISGGESITKVTAAWVASGDAPPVWMTPAQQSYFTRLPDAASVIVVGTSVAGDFAPYTVRLVNDITTATEHPFEVTDVLTSFDPQLAEVEFSFKVECPPFFDCAPQNPDCPPELPTPPPINYLAKDYSSFRGIMLDRLSQLLPGWSATSEADLGIALTELIAYVADHLSYQQDAVATEAYLETARSRISLRRHAVLVDYQVHDGCNARAWVQVQVKGNPGDTFFLDRSTTKFFTAAPGMPSPLTGNERTAVLAGVQVFEPMWDQILYFDHNQMSFYTWGDDNCCLPKGATEATLRGTFDKLQSGDVLIFQEMKGPETGAAADADLLHRCAVRLTNVATKDSGGNLLVDPLFDDQSGNPITVTEIQWSQEDALPFPLCISSTYLDENGNPKPQTDVSLAFGNVVLADHGLSFPAQPLPDVPQPWLKLRANPGGDWCQTAAPETAPVRYRPLLDDKPLTQSVPIATVPLAAIGTPQTAGIVFLSSEIVTLQSAASANCLTLKRTDATGWPQYFGVIVSPTAVPPGNAGNVDVAVVYSPPDALSPTTVELHENLSFNAADPRYLVTQIGANSKLITVPSPPSTPAAGFLTVPTMLSNTGPVEVQDLSRTAFLTIQPTDTTAWPQLFGVEAQPVGGLLFNLKVEYDPGTAVNVVLPVKLEEFDDLSLNTAAAQVNGKSELIVIETVASTAAPGISAHALSNYEANLAVPAITLSATANQSTATWKPVQSLLESGESDRVFVVEVETDGTAQLHFGDNTNGETPVSGTKVQAIYRIGNGTAGNVGADTLTHFEAAPALAGSIQSCTNPLPASGGVDLETNDQIRRRAPQAFLTQERAIKMADYAAVAEQNPGIDRAVASLRWTGSWYTVFIAAEPQGGGFLSAAQQKTLKSNVNLYHLAGQDLEVDSPQYVPLLIGLDICVDTGYFKADVEQAVMRVLSSGISPNGQKGFFFPDNFTFGQSVYLSPIFAAVRSVAGVVSVRATSFQPQGLPATNDFLNNGEIPIEPLQVAQLANDPSFPNHGQLTLTMEGGK
jgi:uncharacterized phage protein gp47/JayE